MGLLRSSAVVALMPALFLFGCSSIEIVKDGKKARAVVSYSVSECAPTEPKGRLFAGSIPKPVNCRKDTQKVALELEDDDNNTEETNRDALKRFMLKGLKTGFKLYNWLPMAAGE